MHRPVPPSHIQAWVKDRARVLAPATRHTVYAYLAAIFGAAAIDRDLAGSPYITLRSAMPTRPSR